MTQYAKAVVIWMAVLSPSLNDTSMAVRLGSVRKYPSGMEVRELPAAGGGCGRKTKGNCGWMFGTRESERFNTVQRHCAPASQGAAMQTLKPNPKPLSIPTCIAYQRQIRHLSQTGPREIQGAGFDGLGLC